MCTCLRQNCDLEISLTAERSNSSLPSLQLCPASSETPCSRSLPLPRGTGQRQKAKVRKPAGWDKDSSVAKERERKKWNKTSGVKAITDQWLPPKKTLPWCLLLSATSGISLWSVGASCPSCVPSRPPAHPQPAHQEGRMKKERAPWRCASTAQQQPKHGCITNAALVTNPKHRTTQAPLKKVHSIPDRASTLHCQFSQVHRKATLCLSRTTSKGLKNWACATGKSGYSSSVLAC